MLQKVRITMDKKYENGMSFEQLIGEMLKDAKVVKIPIQPKQDAGQKAQKSDKLLAAHPTDVQAISLNIENLHIHMDERMTSYNYGIGQESAEDSSVDTEDDSVDDIDVDEMVEHIHKETGLCEKVILTVLAAQTEYLDSIWGEDDSDEEDEA